MKLSKRHILTVASLGAFLAFASLTQAQDTKPEAKPEKPATTAARPPRRGGGPANFDQIATQLKLTDEQKTKLQPLFQDESKKLRDIRQDTSLNAQQKREKSREARDEFTAKIKPILTPEQMDQFKKLRDQQGGPRGPRGNRNADGAKPEKSSSDNQ